MSALEDLYARVPEVPCKGLCQESCGPLPMAVAEARALRRAGRPIPHHEIALVRLTEGGYDCPALEDGRCSVYDLRPMLCRLWGAVEDMPCPFGCIPVGGYLTAAEGHALIGASLAAGGGAR